MAKKKIDIESFNAGYELGIKAFNEGKKAACLHKTTMDLIAENKYNTLDLLRGWEKGYHKENLSKQNEIGL